MTGKPGLHPSWALPSLLLLFLALFPGAGFAESTDLGIQGGVYRVTMDLPGIPPPLDSVLVCSLVIHGLRDARLESYLLDPGLSVESMAGKPFVAASEARGTEILLGLRSSVSGRRAIRGLRFVGEEGGFEIPRIEVSFTDTAQPGILAQGESWEWAAPVTVTRFEGFRLRLRSRSGIPDGSWPAFALPEGLVLETGSDGFSWVATALEAGSLLLPEADISAKPRGFAPAFRITVRDIPPSISSSRAIGNFSLSLDGPPSALSGDRVLLRVIVSGRGNFPFLTLPAPLLSFEGQALPPGDASWRRVDAFRADGESWVGEASWEIWVRIHSPGLFELGVASWPCLTPGGEVKALASETFTLRIASSDDGRGRGAMAAVERLSKLLKVRRGDSITAFLAALSRGDTAAARVLAAGLGPGRQGRADRVLSEAAISFSVGRAGEGLASLYRAARREDASLRPVAGLVAADLGAELPDFRSWPNPFVALASALAVLAAFFLVIVKRRRRGRAASLASPLPIALALAAILATAVSIAAFQEGSRIHYLSWSPYLAALPSLDAESSLAVDPGRNGNRLASVPGWIYLRFSNGSSGWISDTMVYSW
ncbi:MAG: hypothetical protein ACOYM2_08030 [Rectinemataceae bacterium]